MKKTGLILVLLLTSQISFSQRQKAKKLRNFDNRKLHFGFLIGYNSADFYLDTKPGYFQTDSLLSIQNYRQPGFNLQMIGSWNLNKNISLRFLPGLSFQECKLEYTYVKNSNQLKIQEKRISPNYFVFPLNLKLRTDRINNFAAYAIGGAQFGVDMASQKKVNNSGANTIVKIKRGTWDVQMGGGLDFFLPYFKFGIELKFSRGFNNLLIQDETKFAGPISVLKTKVWVLSITLEG